MATVVKPESVKTLAEFVARSKKAANLGFDPETREATVYSDVKRTARVKSFPWKREVDTLTVLSQPTRFSALAVGTAAGRLAKFRGQRTLQLTTAEKSLQVAEAAVLGAWRSYRAATDAVKPSLRRDVLSAEAALLSLQKSLVDKNRVIIEFKQPSYRPGGKGFYVPPMPSELRGISLVEGTAAAAPSDPFASASAAAYDPFASSDNPFSSPPAPAAAAAAAPAAAAGQEEEDIFKL